MMFIYIIIAVVILYLLFDGNSWKGFNKTNKAEDLLRERFIKGEITEEEYQKMKRILEEK